MLPVASLPSQGNASLALLRAIVVAVALALFVGGLVALVRSLGDEPPQRTRQVSRIAVLPDTPPPPPPPPERKPEPPKSAPKTAAVPAPQAKADVPKADAPLKMEGPAGDGPSAFQQGAVTQDYAGGVPQIGGGASSPGIADRAQERLYANTVRQMLQGEIERRLAPEVGELTSSFAIWVQADGRISRFEVDGEDAPMRDALQESARHLQLPPPPSSAPLRFRLTVRGAG